MGRWRRAVPTGRLRLKYKKDNYDSQKAYTLYYEYNWRDDNPIRRDTGLRVKVEDWNDKGGYNHIGELRPSFGANYKQRNAILVDTLKKYDDLLETYNDKHPNQITSKIIHSILFDEPLTRADEGKDFGEYAIKVLTDKLGTSIKTSRYVNGMSAMKIFGEFLASKGLGTHKTDGIYLGEISPELVRQYIEYRKVVKKNLYTTINHALQPIIDACNDAVLYGYISAALAKKIENCRLTKNTNYNGNSRSGKNYLTKEQLQSIVEYYEKDTEPRRKEYIEMFLFCFHCGGLRPIDMMSLAWDDVNFDDKVITKLFIKTDDDKLPRNVVPLNDAAIKILKAWQQKNLNTRFVFDLLPADFNLVDSDELRRTRGNVETKINQALKIVGENIGLSFPLTLKVARHSFAILALKNGMIISMVSRMLGHSSTTTTEQYYAEHLPQSLADELKKLDFNFVPDLNTTE